MWWKARVESWICNQPIRKTEECHIVGTRSHPSIGTVILSPYSSSLPWHKWWRRWLWIKDFDVAIRVNLILVDNSARRRSPHTWPEAPPSQLKGGCWQARSGETWLHRAVGCLICQGPPWLHHPDWHCLLPPVWPLKSCRSLTIPPFRSSGFGHVHSGPSSLTLPSWTSRQE